MSTRQKIVAIIPARYHSTRFEGKPLAKICGQPMIYHVYQSTRLCKILDDVVVATDDQRIFDAVKAFGGNVVMTSNRHPTGTDRVAEAARLLKADIVVNVQGDEPLIKPELIAMSVNPLLEDPNILVTNLISKLSKPADSNDATVVKAALDTKEFLMFLTRAAIPYPRFKEGHMVYKQIGVYAFRLPFLQLFVDMPQTPLELIEGIEFLRILENGYKIKAVVVNYDTVSVDTPSDLKEVESIMTKSLKVG